MTSYSARSTSGGWLMDAITRNPEGLLLLAGGCALLMRKAASARFAEREGNRHLKRSERNGHHRMEARGDNGDDRNLRDTVAEAARSVGEYASDVSDKVTESASAYASSVADYAHNASEHTRERARQAGSALQSSAQTILQEQPLAVAVNPVVRGQTGVVHFAHFVLAGVVVLVLVVPTAAAPGVDVRTWRVGM